MLATLIIVFREVLEAALIVGIVLAASRGVPRREQWISAGIAGGVLGALIVASLASEIASAVEGVGQELFNAGILFAAVGMLGWHNIWMQRHGRELAQSATAIGRAVLAGTRPLYALAVVVGVAVLREGSEIVLFLYSIAVAGGSSATSMITGGVLGLAVGVGVGAGLYLGLLAIPLRHLFTVTSWLILFLAAGMASQGAAFLLQADLLPALGNNLWDTSFLLSERSLPGQVVHVLLGYSAQPAGIQVVFYLATLVIIGSLMRLLGGMPAPAPRRDLARS
ncbi:MAG TPA: FTR1 family protein [Stellaceae bacterium]|jgi:high-affinity iron transporter|nr:FTR1 family protein [Stellaceae bacterium]